MVRCVSVDPSGYWMLSGSDDNTLRLWEIKTGRCAKVWRFSETVQAVAWNPNRSICMFAVASGTRVSLMTPPAHTVCDDDTYTLTEELLAFTQVSAEDGQEDVNQDPSLLQDEDEANEEDGGEEDEDEAVDARRGDLNSAQRARKLVAWSRPSAKEQQQHNIRYVLHHTRVVQQVTWHRKGDYFSTVCQHRSQSAKTSSFVLIHLLSQRKSQKPFRESKGGAVQKVVFHPTRPHFIVATQRFVRVYDLMRQATTKTLIPGAQWISSVDVHPQGGDTGDHIIVGTYDKKLCWFDLDLSTKPYKVIKFHPKAIRQVCFHPKFPLFTSASDDGTLQVFHATVYQDLLQNPLIVPVKILRGHQITNSLGVLNCQFHPIQPWLISTGADGTIRLWT
ncbi:Ribosome biogenesis protein erb1 [Dimargaris verticillata]|uniref:Ribosome biogenesis protein erb1 n=1 Tax=Dimargaris verticillata TaxID=2761393 RepID=A0A9W8B2A3_9FUNG|nr:Ribosome biogenesis protein erb1 [Dimargaris verticillata]